MQNNMQNYEIDEQTGEVLEGGEQAEKTSKAKVSWGVRLDQDTIEELEEVAEILGINGDKRAVLEYLLKVRKTAELKGQTKGKIDSIEHVEKALDTIRQEMNTLLRHNISKEEEIRDVVSSEMLELEQKIKSAQDKLNNQLEISKELKEENKSLKANIVDKDKEIKETSERYADTNKLIARLEKTEVENQAKLVEFEELKLTHKDLQTASANMEKELSKAQAEIIKINADLDTTKQSLADKNKELTTTTEANIKEVANLKESNKKQIESLKEANMKELENIKAVNILETNNAVLKKELELKNIIQELKDDYQVAKQEAENHLKNVQAKYENKIIEKEKAHAEQMINKKEEYNAEVSKLREEIKKAKEKSTPNNIKKKADPAVIEN